MLQDVPNDVGGRVHSDRARNLASCRQALRRALFNPRLVYLRSWRDL